MKLLLQNVARDGFITDDPVIIKRKQVTSAREWCMLNAKGVWNYGTIDKFKTAFYFSDEVDRDNFENWKS